MGSGALIAFQSVGLRCGVPVIGISLDPLSAQNEVGTGHTVTATLFDPDNNPQVGILVTFIVESGPNAGATGSCAGNADCTTDNTGNVSFT